MPVVGSHRPITYPRRTSHAARYCSAPPRSYSCSMRARRPGAGAGRMAADAGLDAGLLISTEDVVFGAKGLALPGARIQIQNRSSLLRKVGIPGKDPVLVPPWLDGISGQNPPHRTPTDRFGQRVLRTCGHVSQ